ncbi:hypothetical protein OG948_36615 (plasmid) [Embleya sp. NBC_00888]|uniref:hypothetical protein n=1 Tax=Embleya sp. NBC_00888 TaxID=2975960 RepID=UPI002F915C9A|nr:hypothetical protein OG948_36615 [Embleya sp. NBC_00888]
MRTTRIALLTAAVAAAVLAGAEVAAADTGIARDGTTLTWHGDAGEGSMSLANDPTYRGSAQFPGEGPLGFGYRGNA